MIAQALKAMPVSDDSDWTVAVFGGGPGVPRDRYDRLGEAFVACAWNGGFHPWIKAVRVLAGALRGLETTGLIERRTVRRKGHPPHRTWMPTEIGRAVAADLFAQEQEA
jgi:hypothetical protein